jgi:arylsulfatase A-like enzyme
MKRQLLTALCALVSSTLIAADPWTHKYHAGHPYEDTWHRDGTISGAEGNATELVAAEALNRISHGGDQPWFVYVPFHAVHTPVDAPEQYKRIYDGVRFHDDPVKHESRLRMAAMVAQLDAKIGEFVAALERTGKRERTLIIFTSDNGGAESRRNGYVGTVPHSPYNSENAPLRGEKDSLYEGGIRVCAFANWPGRLSPGKVTAPLYVGDWLPTVAGLVGLKPAADPGWDGLDRWDVVSNANATPPPRTWPPTSRGCPPDTRPEAPGPAASANAADVCRTRPAIQQSGIFRRRPLIVGDPATAPRASRASRSPRQADRTAQ